MCCNVILYYNMFSYFNPVKRLLLYFNKFYTKVSLFLFITFKGNRTIWLPGISANNDSDTVSHKMVE